jgi:hypothetical protein
MLCVEPKENKKTKTKEKGIENKKNILLPSHIR